MGVEHFINHAATEEVKQGIANIPAVAFLLDDDRLVVIATMLLSLLLMWCPSVRRRQDDAAVSGIRVRHLPEPAARAGCCGVHEWAAHPRGPRQGLQAELGPQQRHVVAGKRFK